MNASPELLAALGAATVLAFVLAIWAPAYVRARAMGRRLAGFVETEAMAMDLGGQRRDRTTAQAERRPSGPIAWMRTAIAAADVDLTPFELATASVVLAVSAAGVAGLVSGSVPVGIVAGAIGLAAPALWLRWRAGRTHARFIAQLPETIDLMATMVRSGNTFLQAMEHVAAESPEPMATALSVVVREIGLGSTQDEALERLLQRFPSDDLALIVASVNIHQQTGGSLAAILDRIAETLRERIRLQGDIRAFTAMQRYSAYVLGALPLVVAAILMLVSPEYIRLLLEPGLLRLFAVLAVGMAVLGFIALQRMAKIDV